MEDITQEQVDFANMLARDIQQLPRRWADVVRYGVWSRPHQDWDWGFDDFDEEYDSDADEDRPTEPWEELPDEDW